MRIFRKNLFKQNHREDRDSRTMPLDSNRSRVSQGGAGGGGDEEWKNIHTMLSCISGMVEKTKRAISILQQRGSDTVPPTLQDTSLIGDIKRQTEEKIAEFRRSAEDSVNQVNYTYFLLFLRKLKLY